MGGNARSIYGIALLYGYGSPTAWILGTDKAKAMETLVYLSLERELSTSVERVSADTV